jgi:glutamyl/glutaminyl-tRNA synthetase
MTQSNYRGRIAPSPSGWLHLGHARTFWTAYQRALDAGGVLVFRNEDLDPQRSRPEFASAMVTDLSWLGIRWQEGPEVDATGEPTGADIGPDAPYQQSQRGDLYLAAWRKLLAAGHLYPCHCSRKELAQAASAPHETALSAPDIDPIEPTEALYPGTCRRELSAAEIAEWREHGPAGTNWRFRLQTTAAVTFRDNNPTFGEQAFVPGHDFGDFPIWRRDNVPAYQLAVVVDDAAMRISEVVRGADLLLSTARQILLQQALFAAAAAVPQYFHCELLTDAQGQRLAKRSDALSLRTLRQQGWTPQRVRASW